MSPIGFETAKDLFLRSLADVEMHEELNQLSRESGLSVSDLAITLPGVSGVDTVKVDLDEHKRRLLIWRRLQQLAREWTSPHALPTTAGNFELMAMNVGRLVRGCDVLIEQYDLPCNWSELLNAAGETDPRIARVWASVDQWWELVDKDVKNKNQNLAGEFLGEWVLGGFPRLEISHKYAAALCCTDCPPEIDVHAPWKAWSLVVPPDLVGEGTPSRLWVLGKYVIGFLFPDGRLWTLEEALHGSYRDVKQYAMLDNLVRGACLSISEPEQHRKHQRGQSHSKGNKRSGPPDLSQARFMLAPPVTVDLRQHIIDALRPGGGGVPKVQFLVRGHFRQQVHGAGRALRKTIWIEPHWKGPETGHVLLRPHKLKESDE